MVVLLQSKINYLNFMYKWESYPYPYCVIDNFLSTNEFNRLQIELNSSSNTLQTSFKTPLEEKSIYKDKTLKKEAKNIMKIMGSNEIKNLISTQINSSEIISFSETENFSGYSPFHITKNRGCLGSHVDHSFISNGKFRHIANTIFYASEVWEKDWGGQTILFSRNGFNQKVRIEPIPNRLIIFIHTANSFHGVSLYKSNCDIERRTFYHDYYVPESEIDKVMHTLNKNRIEKLIHSSHGTTFIPFIPYGLKNVNFKKLLSVKNFRYFPPYFIYLLNRFTNSTHISFKTVPLLRYLYYLYKFLKKTKLP